MHFSPKMFRSKDKNSLCEKLNYAENTKQWNSSLRKYKLYSSNVTLAHKQSSLYIVVILGKTRGIQCRTQAHVIMRTTCADTHSNSPVNSNWRQGRLSLLTPWSKVPPSPPLRSRPPLLRLGVCGSTLAPPAGLGGARPPNGIWWISG